MNKKEQFIQSRLDIILKSDNNPETVFKRIGEVLSELDTKTSPYRKTLSEMNGFEKHQYYWNKK